jgi:polyisoprenoid-binding protein YceI
MSKSLFKTTALALCLSLYGMTAYAADKFEVDGLHSSVMFKVLHGGLSNFYGRFNKVAGEFDIDSKASKCSVNIEVWTGSVDSNDVKRDKHLKGPDFFNAVQFPKMTFKSKAVKKVGVRAYEITGDLKLHGISKEIKVTATHIGTRTNSRGQTRCGFEIKFSIKRSDFGMKYGLSGIGDQVDITVAIEARKK